MKLYTAKPSQKKLKYHEEQIHYTLDGTSEYNWRKVQKEIKELKEIASMPKKLDFVTDKIEFEELDKFSWLKSDFRLPILNNNFIELLINTYEYEYTKFPIKIINKKNSEQVNLNYSGFYVKGYFDCVDRNTSETIKYGELEYYDYRTAKFGEDLEYPPLFKIKDISTPFMHFVTDEYKMNFLELNLKGFDMEELNKTRK
ncbi:hypothetical protein [uncultured Arcticibacterium sp.]|uniref:hypothetical protein n=1 Tax=uncultured Arcticibacterium sp. TaxID=2173042 RepID=UPI0030FD0741